MHGEYTGARPPQEEPKANVVPFKKEAKRAAGSHKESMDLLGYPTIKDAQEAKYKLDPKSEEYKKLGRLITLAKHTAALEGVDYEDLDIEYIKKRAA